MKKLFSILSLIAIIAAVIVACKDNFNESDFLTLQSKLKTQQDTAKLNQQIRQLNAAGALLSFTVQVVDDRTPLQGVDVQVSNDVASGSAKVTTDVNGNAVFSKASVGSNTIILSKAGYVTSTAIVDFGTLANGTYYTTVPGANGTTNIVPLKQSKSVLLPMFSTGSTGNTGTIMGKVTIENDLTNTTPEVPQNITIKANYAAAIPSQVQGTGVSVLSYNFNQANLGSAVVNNTTGLYSMAVPASAAGLAISLIIPEVDGSLKMAANTVDSQPANGQPAPQSLPAAIINQPTLWGPNVSASYDATMPNVSGAKLVFNAPPPAGAGLSLAFSSIARPLSVDKFGTGGNLPFNWDTSPANWAVNEANPNSFDIGETSYQITSRGVGYSGSPTITITGGGGTGANMKASLRGVVSSVAVTNGGAGYPDSGTISLEVGFQDNGSNPANHFLFTIANCGFTASGGAISSITLPSTGNDTYGVDWSSPFRTTNAGVHGYNVGSGNWNVVVIGGGGTTTATATAKVATEVDHIQLEKFGSGYTSAPTITFTNGGATTQATMVVREFRTQWSIVLDNSTNTTAYAIPPQNIQWAVDSYNSGQYLDKTVWDTFNQSYNFASIIKASEGKVVQIDPLASYRTSDYFSKKPSAVISPSLSVTVTATVSVNSDGTINQVNIPFSNGKGYNSLIQAVNGTVQPMFPGIPGSGGAIDLTGWNCGDCGAYGEYMLFSGPILGTFPAFITKGTGYLQNVNRQGFVPFSGNPNTNVKTGDIQVIDIKYGTGKRKNIVQ